MPYFNHNGANLFYLVEGYGKVILLIHGWTCDMHDWSFQIPMLVTRGFTTITMDTRGHGRSSTPINGDYSLSTLTDDVAALLGHIGINNALIAGHNTGAIIASALSVYNPELVRGLILVEPLYYLTQRERTNLVEGLQTRDSPDRAASLFARALYTSDTPAWLKAWHMRRARSTPAEAVSKSLVSFFGEGSIGLWDIMKDFGQLRKGPRFVCASENHAVLERGLGMTEQDRVEVITAGAWPHQQASEQFNTLLADWLDNCDFRG